MVEKSNLLRACSNSGIEDPNLLLVYHDCLLFLLAYPQTPDLCALASRELCRVAEEAKRLTERGERDRWTLEDTGVAWSETRRPVSHAIARWLAERFPRDAEVASFADEGEPLRVVLELCMPAIEEGILSQPIPPDQLFEELTEGFKGSRLQWLITQLDRSPASDEIREHLFESLRAYVLVRSTNGPLARTFARGLIRDPFYHTDGLMREVDSKALIAEPLPPPRKLSAQDRVHLIDTARAVLTVLGRDTEAIRSCVPGGVDCFDLERGISIALFAMPPGRRLPIDTHVGFMLFKNAIPIAYGGGWPFIGLCRIGIHIFEPFRGGESALAMCQVLRVYHHRFAAHRFVVEPTQFGEGEPEGLTSGAFWFYYNLGFRSTDRRLAPLIDEELAHIRNGDEHRTSRTLLRRLARSSLELVLTGGDSPAARCDPADLSLAVTNWIVTLFEGDRAAAEEAAFESVSNSLRLIGMERWPEPERRSFRSLCLLVAMVPGLAAWSAADRRGLIAIMRAKGKRDEREYFDRMRSHRRFCEAMVQVAEATAL